MVRESEPSREYRRGLRGGGHASPQWKAKACAVVRPSCIQPRKRQTLIIPVFGAQIKH